MRSEQIEYLGRQLPRPKFWTPRDEGLETLGRRQAAFGSIWLGHPFMPWQDLVADVLGEMLPDGTPRWPLGVVTVQRQGGKSHLCLSRKCERCFSVPGWRSWYTAQTGMDARDQFLKFDDEQIGAESALRPFARTLRGNGHEAMRFPNGSTIRPHPPTATALHGKQSDDNDVDEAWAHDLETGRAIMQAIAPTQLTRPLAQTVIWSAGGTAGSTWLAELVARGRSGDPTLAYFEFGIPDDLELDDLDAIASYHPANGHTLTVESLRRLRTQLTDDSEFARAAGNRWTEAIGGAIPAELWRKRRNAPPIPDDVPVAYGAARAADGSEAVLAAAGRVGDSIIVEVLDVIPSVYDAAVSIKEWLNGEAVAVDPSGPSASLADALKLAGVQVADPTGRQVAAGVDSFLDGLKDGRIACRPNEALDSAVRVAGTRRVGDGGKAWARMAAGASIAALEAATQAVWGVAHAPAKAPAPLSYFPSAS